MAVAERQLLGVLGDERDVGDVRERRARDLQVVRAEIEGRETQVGVGDGDLRQRPPGPAGDVEQAGVARRARRRAREIGGMTCRRMTSAVPAKSSSTPTS
mgnify:CR=1 FL=1